MRQKRSSDRKRKPLSDISNAIHRIPISSSSAASALAASSSKPRPDTNPTSSTLLAPISSSVASVGSSNCHKPNQERWTNPEPDSLPLRENIDKENDGHSKIDSRSCFGGEKSKAKAVAAVKNKGKTVAAVKNKGMTIAAVVPSSCPPRTRNEDYRDQLKNPHNVDLSKKHIISECKSPKKRRHSMAEAPAHALPQDFIDKQKAYFAEIDAFELPEEVSIPESCTWK